MAAWTNKQTSLWSTRGHRMQGIVWRGMNTIRDMFRAPAAYETFLQIPFPLCSSDVDAQNEHVDELLCVRAKHHTAACHGPRYPIPNARLWAGRLVWCERGGEGDLCALCKFGPLAGLMVADSRIQSLFEDPSIMPCPSCNPKPSSKGPSTSGTGPEQCLHTFTSTADLTRVRAQPLVISHQPRGQALR